VEWVNCGDTIESYRVADNEMHGENVHLVLKIHTSKHDATKYCVAWRRLVQNRSTFVAHSVCVRIGWRARKHDARARSR